jgi:hypothetical protein
MKHLKSFKSTYQSIVSCIKSAAMKIFATIVLVSSSSLAVANVATWQAFDGTTVDPDTSTFAFPAGAQSWAGFSNDNSELYPMCFGDGGTVTFTGAVPSGETANVKFRFEYNPYPDVEPSIEATGTVSGSTESNYSVTVPAQDAANTYSSLVMYIIEQDTPVIIKDVAVASTTCPAPEAPAEPAAPDAGDFSEAFGGTTIGEGGVYTFPSSAEGWGGFANMNTALYPLSFANGGSISFDGSVAGGASADIRFRLEYQPHPDVDPAYDLNVVNVSSADATTYTVNIPAQGSNTYSSLIMYVLDRDVPVTISNVVVNSDDETVVPADPVDPSTVAVTFQVDMSAVESVSTDGVYLAGGDIGQDGHQMTDTGNGIWSVSINLNANAQYKYKFRNQAANGGWDGFEPANGIEAGGCNMGDYNDRYVDVAGSNMTLDVVAYGSCTSEPYVAPSGPEIPTAPVPTDAADSVLSIFSTTYGNLDGANFNPGWGQATAVTEGENLVYTNLNYQGTAFANNDVSGYEYLNVDYYVIESTRVDFFLISPGAETSYSLDVSTTGQWNSVQIPLSHYESAVDLTDAFQFKVDGDGSVAFNNLYFGGGSTSNPVDPTDLDGDGVVNDADAFPNDPAESVDTDSDGIGNNADTDDDGDGVADNLDGDPLDPSVGALPQQLITVEGNPSAMLGQSVSISISYDVSDNDSSLTGLGLSVHYDSSVLTFAEFAAVLAADNISSDGPFNDDEDLDNDASTDKYVSAAWASLFGSWPGELPASLLTINFNAAEDVDADTTTIGFSSVSNASGYAFAPTSYDMSILSGSWDFDRDGTADALTDGLMLLRYTFGLRGASLTDSAISSNSTLSPSEVEANVAASTESFADIDGSANVDALTDGLMLLRYLFGLRGDSLIDAAVANGASRSTATDIEAYIISLMP